MQIEYRFATKTYEYINVSFDHYPTDEEYLRAKQEAEKHKNFVMPIKVEPPDDLPVFNAVGGMKCA